MDFIASLPICQRNGINYDNILVVTDRLSKQVHFTPCATENHGTSAPAVANIYVRDIWRLHGLPKTIVSDRGTQFDSLFWRRLCQRLGIQLLMSTAYHP